MTKRRRTSSSQTWVVFVVALEWTIIFCGMMAALVIVMLH